MPQHQRNQGICCFPGRVEGIEGNNPTDPTACCCHSRRLAVVKVKKRESDSQRMSGSQSSSRLTYWRLWEHRSVALEKFDFRQNSAELPWMIPGSRDWYWNLGRTQMFFRTVRSHSSDVADGKTVQNSTNKTHLNAAEHHGPFLRKMT